MPTLRPTTVASLWPRQILLTDAYRGWQLLERSQANMDLLFTLSTTRECEVPDAIQDFCSESGHLENNEITPALHIRHLDQLYGQGTPGLTEQIEQEAALIGTFSQRLRVRELNGPTPLSLPTSVARLARLLRTHCRESIYLDTDAHGLGILLSHSQRVSIRTESEVQKRWLALQLDAEALPMPAVLLESSTAPDQHGLSYGVASTPDETYRSIERCRAALQKGGLIALSARRPYEQWLRTWLEEQSIDVVATYRGVDQWLIPEGFCADYPGDLVILRCPPSALEPPSFELRQQRIEQPSLVFGVHQLAQARLSVESLDEFADLLSGLGPHRETERAIHTTDELWTLSWYDEAGFGLTLEIRPKAQHACVTLMPFELHLERAVMHAVLLTWADTYTRVEPMHTYWSGNESVYA